jgi:hypothetical protein
MDRVDFVLPIITVSFGVWTRIHLKSYKDSVVDLARRHVTSLLRELFTYVFNVTSFPMYVNIQFE